MIKKILIAVVGLVVLLVAAAVIVPFLIPTDTIKRELQAQVKQATGRDLTIAGSFEFSLLPDAVLKAGDVRFQNAEGGSRADMLTLQELRVHVALLPLFSSEVEVQEFVLESPDILLEVDRNGRPNWQLQTAAGADGGGGQTSGGGNGASDGQLQAVSLGDVRIVDGRLEYRNAQSGTVEVLENLNLQVTLPSLDEPFSADGEATWHQKAIAVMLGAQSPRALITGGETDITVALDGEPLKLGYQGALDAGAGSVAGKLNLEVPSVRDLAAWVGSPLEIQGEEVLNELRLAGDIAASAAEVSITGMTLSLDDINTTGDLSVALGGNVPKAEGRLDVEALDLNPYMTAFGDPDGQSDSAPAQGGGAAGSGEWSNEPIDLSALRAVDADLTLSAGSLQAQDIKIGKSAVRLQLEGGKLTADLSEMALYNGNGSLQLNVDAAGDTPSIQSTFALSGLQAEPFLNDAAKIEWLSGTAAMDISVTTRGNSQKALANALNGNGSMTFTDGAVRGTNLAALLRGVSTLNLDPSSWETAKTDFAELGGTFTIADGILKNDDLTLKSQLLRVVGQGTVGIGPRNIDYTAEPKAVATLEGQGGAVDVKGLPIGVHVHGSWDDPQTDYRLGGDSLADLARNPEALVSTLSNLGAIADPDALRDKLGDLGGADSGVLDALKGLGGGTGSSPTDSLRQLLPGGSTEQTDPNATEPEQESGTGSDPADSIRKLFGQ